MNVYLTIGLEATPVALRRLMKAIDEERWDVPISEGRFTPREVVAHLADWEPILRDRCATIIQNPGATVKVWDEGAMAIAHNYSQSDVWEQCDKFAEHRARTIAFIRSIPDNAWEKTGFHPERGIISVRDQANLLLGHDLYHLEQITASL